MPRSGGTYSLPAGNPVTTGTVVSSTWANSTLNDIGSELTNSIPRDGSAPPSANLPMNGFKHQNVATATSAAEYARADQVQNATLQYLTSIAGANTITGSVPIAPAAYVAGQVFRFISAGANTGAVTLNVNGLGAKAIVKGATASLAAGDIPSGAIVEVVYDGTQFQLATAPLIAGKNRFANGAFAFDQRTNGAAISVSPGDVPALDCTRASGTGTGAFSVQQIATGGPVGSPTFARMTVTTADAAMAATDQYVFYALLEGVDTADLGWGAAGALPISMGFWFRSSLTGTFSGSIRNAATARSYPISWTYSAANVWQFVPIQGISGDTAGVWPTTNVRSMLISFSLGAGSNFSGAAGAWVAGNVMNVTGAANLISTNGATMDIALLQVESGTACTPFEWVPYPAGLARVQRYYETGEYFVVSAITPSASPFDSRGFCAFKVTKRTVPSAIAGTSALSGFSSSTVTAYAAGFLLFGNTNSSGQCSITYTNWSAAAEL